MKLLIREKTETLKLLNTEESGFNFYRFKLYDMIKYIVLYSDG
jgi:hypothetical protein